MRKKMPINKKRIRLLVAVQIFIITVFIILDMRINSAFKELSRYYCSRNASSVISESVNEILEETSAEYSDLAALVYDEEGNVVSAETITYNVNKIQTMIIERINNKIGSETNNTVKIPLGTASGSYLLNGRGPKVKMKFIPSGNVQTDLTSSFTSAGINQTCHKITIEIHLKCSAIYPGGKTESDIAMNCILAENIIVGDIPESIIGKIS